MALDQNQNVPLKEYLKKSPEVQEYLEQDPSLKRYLETDPLFKQYLARKPTLRDYLEGNGLLKSFMHDCQTFVVNRNNHGVSLYWRAGWQTRFWQRQRLAQETAQDGRDDDNPPNQSRNAFDVGAVINDLKDELQRRFRGGNNGGRAGGESMPGKPLQARPMLRPKLF